MGTAALDIGGTAIKSGIWTGIKDEIKEVRRLRPMPGLEVPM